MSFQGDLTVDDEDIALLKLCVEMKRQNIAKFLITNLKCRAHCEFEVRFIK